MAYDRKITKYDVRPEEDGKGRLDRLIIQRTLRVERVADNGRILDYGLTQPVGEPIEILAKKVPDLVRELTDWMMYYATGRAADEAEEDARGRA
ncbi:hypothetical protein SEA_SLIMJIMMY_142 [Mycobacterium phage SlimJimmy]|uniref:Uncharacterized protein n=3 Tax=Bongovirus bongo TaxID=1983750 RepID=A0A0M4S444_9CAUD|nr:hypothetical protein SEA_BRICOLE_146 [Mycobacterium phage Bricole]AXQ52764.1 hypothetical protein SEA_IPHANE7_142 [Mycobacterium phage IPhane7]QGJ93266.1 hypothetical protein SEA_TYDAWG_138 [Mycobacterium phage TyDawg]WMI33303.1 hypothetical protein SEA_SLIMJIMMY_142 [Mycobacterium phage SlimJimmy]WNM75335.1 hypothetical protein SEA_AUSPICE_145 [Mycobacterium phage Auspice]